MGYVYKLTWKYTKCIPSYSEFKLTSMFYRPISKSNNFPCNSTFC